ncbi:hypothetical protein B0H14DRAFT_2894061 [Mycena olivaceomarginata]|nr:hypothetical protein B0H14DRAFT_2894061 [Mycena olivaceomarginata]
MQKTSSTYGDAGLKEEDFDPYRLEETQRPILPQHFRLTTRGLSFRLMRWPAIVVSGQLVLQALGWGFFAVVKYHGQLALPFSTATWVDNNSLLVTLISTLVSTLLAGVSSFLFSYAIRRSMFLYLYRPMSLAALGASVSISMRSVVFHRRLWKWSVVSLFFFMMTGIQTSGWSTLITPVKVVVPTLWSAMKSICHGKERDFGFVHLCRQVVPTHRQLRPLSLRSVDLDVDMFDGLQQSGYATGQSSLGLPATVSLLDQTFNVSTRGILAANLDGVNVSSWSIPSTTHGVEVLPRGLSVSHSVNQQGFTADVSCRPRDLSNRTSPSILRSIDVVTSWSTNRTHSANVTDVYISSNCTIEPFTWLNTSEIYVNIDMEYLVSLQCSPVPEAPNNYTLILSAASGYGWISASLECQIAPKTTLVQVDYGATINATVESDVSPALEAAGAAGIFAMHTIYDLIWNSQALDENVVGNQLTVMAVNAGAGNIAPFGDDPDSDSKVLRLIILRTCLSAVHSDPTMLVPFPTGVPLNMTRPTHGTYYTQTIGWTYTSATGWVLVPGTFIALSTIILVMVALYRHGGEIPKDTHSFDPSNPLHLIAAAASGGLNTRGFEEADIKEWEKIDVLLGSVPGRGPALVRADEYQPMFTDTLALWPLPRQRSA